MSPGPGGGASPGCGCKGLSCSCPSHQGSTPSAHSLGRVPHPSWKGCGEASHAPTFRRCSGPGSAGWCCADTALCPQDLKPSNLAVNEDCELKVCGAGHSGPPCTCPSACWAPALRPGGGLAQDHMDGSDPGLLGLGRVPRAALGGVARAHAYTRLRRGAERVCTEALARLGQPQGRSAGEETPGDLLLRVRGRHSPLGWGPWL